MCVALRGPLPRPAPSLPATAPLQPLVATLPPSSPGLDHCMHCKWRAGAPVHSDASGLWPWASDCNYGGHIYACSWSAVVSCAACAHGFRWPRGCTCRAGRDGRRVRCHIAAAHMPHAACGHVGVCNCGHSAAFAFSAMTTATSTVQHAARGSAFGLAAAGRPQPQGGRGKGGGARAATCSRASVLLQM